MQITTQETTTILNANSQFLAYTDGKNIYQLQPLGMGQNQKVIVGVTQQTYDELQEMTDKYYNKLVELGVITPPKTAEEIAAEQQQAMQDMLGKPQVFGIGTSCNSIITPPLQTYGGYGGCCGGNVGGVVVG